MLKISRLSNILSKFCKLKATSDENNLGYGRDNVDGIMPICPAIKTISSCYLFIKILYMCIYNKYYKRM